MYTEFIKQSSLYNFFHNLITTKFNYFFSCFNRNTSIYVLYKKNNIIDSISIDWDYYDDNSNIDIFPYNWRFEASRNTFQKEYSKLNDSIFVLDKIFHYVIQDNCIPPDMDNVFIVPMFDIENMSR